VDELTVAIEAALRAGAMLRDEFHRPGGPRGGGETAVIDALIEEELRATFARAFPSDGFQGEERSPQQPSTRRYWCVDPNDGTSAFLEGDRMNAVSIGLIEDGEPILGVVYAPLYPDDDGDLIAYANGRLTRNGAAIDPRPLPETLGPHDVVALARGAERSVRDNLAAVRPARFRPVASLAYRIALVAAGEAEAAVGLHGCSAWDVAAAHALLRARGGDLFLEDGTRARYAPFPEVTRTFASSESVAHTLANRPWRWDRVDPPHDKRFPFEAPLRPRHGEATRDAARLRRAQGALLGLCAGDSLGQLVEFQTEASIRARYPDGVRALEDGGTWRLLAGQPTDDSELALLLARTIAHRGELHASVFEAYQHWLDDAFDIGNTIGRALRGVPDANSQANGSLMRIAPLAIFGHALSPDQLAALAREESARTHPNAVCGDACAVYCVALACALNGAPPSDAFAYTEHWATAASIDVDVLATLRAAESRAPEDFQTHQGWVRVALQNAFHQLLHAPSFEHGVVETVHRGGDTDTNAAIAGALLGAVHGRDAIPAQWRRLVVTCRPVEGTPTAHPRPRPYWPVDALTLAERLLVAGSRAAT